MKHVQICAVAFSAFLLGCGTAKDSSLNGVWKSQAQGTNATTEKNKTISETWTIRDGKITSDTTGTPEISYNLNLSANPTHLDTTIRSPGRPDQTWLGIFKLEGDVLTICQAISPDQNTIAARPAQFNPPDRTDCRTLIFRREK